MKKLSKKRPKCISCSQYLQSWGTTATGKRRYRCFSCGTSRLYHPGRKKQTHTILRGLFKQYILWGVTYEMLSEMSGYSLPYLVSQFHLFLQEEPPLLPLPPLTGRPTYLLIDGLWFNSRFVLMVYRRSKNLLILHISVAGREVRTKIARDLTHLHKIGYRFAGLVSDGGTGIVSAITTVYPHTPHQICLAHMHRAITSSLGRYPKDRRVRALRKLADHVWRIESVEALRWWVHELEIWKETHILYLLETRRDDTGKRWYIHKGVRKALRIMFKLPSISFTFLRHPLLPKTTNELEAQFGHLGKRWLAHRGLKTQRWESFMRWFVYFYNHRKLTGRRNKKV